METTVSEEPRASSDPFHVPFNADLQMRDGSFAPVF